MQVAALKGSALRRAWWGSLPFRVVVMTLVASSVVAVLGGMLLIWQATNGVYSAKLASARAEAQTALEAERSRFDGVLGTETPTDLTVLALSSNSRSMVSGQYEVVVETSYATSKPGSLEVEGLIPTKLRDRMTSSQLLYDTATLVHFTDGRRPIPGIVVGALVEIPNTGEYARIYYVFPLTSEVQTLDVLRQAVVTVWVLLVVALAAIAYFVARTVVSPVRRAALTARRIASGHLDERMPVRSSDEYAVLGTSMNHMAEELEKQISSYEELARMQQRFVSDVSHELRTPLTTVRMAAEVLHDSRETLSGVQSRSTEILHSSLERFEGMLADLLEISRFDAGAADLNPERANVADVVADEADGQRAFADRSGIQLIVSHTGDTTALVDSLRLRRIVRNLVVNAIEHGEGRPVTIATAGSEDTVAVRVRDRGIGFEPSQASMVFHRFWRADPSRDRTVGGTGLGLAIALEDAQLHGGVLEARGEPGRGAVFRLTLPREPGAPLGDSPLLLELEGEDSE